MKIPISQFVRPIPLADYAPELGAVTVYSWVNPPRAMLDEYVALRNRHKAQAEAGAADEPAQAEFRAIAEGFADWYARLWSAATDPATHWTAAEVQALAALDTDPALYQWLTMRSWQLIAEHREREKKT